jgi:hypothetical protein
MPLPLPLAGGLARRVGGLTPSPSSPHHALQLYRIALDGLRNAMQQAQAALTGPSPAVLAALQMLQAAQSHNLTQHQQQQPPQQHTYPAAAGSDVSDATAVAVAAAAALPYGGAGPPPHQGPAPRTHGPDVPPPLLAAIGVFAPACEQAQQPPRQAQQPPRQAQQQQHGGGGGSSTLDAEATLAGLSQQREWSQEEGSDGSHDQQQPHRKRARRTGDEGGSSGASKVRQWCERVWDVAESWLHC